MIVRSFIFIFTAMSLVCCTTGSKFGQSPKDQAEVNTTVFSLAETLRGIPSVIVSGPPGSYNVRVTSSRDSRQSPLFIVNGQYAMSFRDATLLLAGKEILTAELLPDLESDGYGRRGQGGVIVIQAN